MNSNYTPPILRKSLDIKQYNRSEEGQFSLKNDDFYTIARETKDYIYKVYDKKIEQRVNGELKEDYVNIYHEAMLGIPSAVNLIKKHIEEFIIEEGLKNVSYPKYYKTLVDALFEEEFGWGPLSAFRYEEDLEGAQVLGTDIKFKRSDGWELQPFKFRNVQQVMDLAFRFSNMHSKTTLNEHSSPELETRTHDNIRVSIMIPGRMHGEPVITLRRKVLKELNFKMLAGFGTLPYEAIPLLESLARFSVNSVIAGPPGCGKSTLLQAFLNHALYEKVNGRKIPERVNTVYAEPFPEWDVRTLHPQTNVLHIIGKGEDFEKIVASSILRHDISRVVIGEIREHEVGLYKRASLQGIKQVMGTIHDLDPQDIPEIMSNIYMQYYSNGIKQEVLQKTFARNLHFSISMDEFMMEDNGRDFLAKKITGIHLYEADPESDTVKMYTIMNYDSIKDEWTYNSEMPSHFKRLISKYNRKSAEDFYKKLNSLETKSEAVGV